MMWQNGQASGYAPMYSAEREKLAPHFKKMGAPKPGEWLHRHKEDGQTFAEWMLSDPVRPDKNRDTIYILPLGDFNDDEQAILEASTEFIGLFYAPMKVKVTPTLPLRVIPASARRVHPTWGDKQILSTYVLDRVLRPRLPKDGVCIIALTNSDLYPADDWNFVFGQASLRHRVGVWSFYRNGDPGEEKALCLSRTVKTAVHEIGHMFTMKHCTAYGCGMSGSNSRQESDRRPIAFCPECVSKVWSLTKAKPKERYEKLAAFCKKNGMKESAELFETLKKALEE